MVSWRSSATATLSLVPTPSVLLTRTGSGWLAASKRKRPPKPPMPASTAGRRGGGGCSRDPLDGARRLLDVDARLPIGAGHAQPRSMASLSSSSGTSVGYTPSKHAVQRASVRPPTDSSMASFER